MILTGHLLLDDHDGRCRIEPGIVRIEDDTLAEVVIGETMAKADGGGDNCLICPGLIDAHLHLPQFDIIGAHGLPLLQWLEKVTFPAESKWADADHAADSTVAAINTLLRHGTTGMAAFATVHHEATSRALSVARDRGMRAAIGQVLMDRGAPASLCRSAAELIDQTAELTKRFPPGQRVACAVTPRFALACSETLLAGAGQLAADRGTLIQSHLAETQRECDEVERLFGRRYVEVYRDCGLLSPRSLFGHGIHLNATDLEVLAETQTRVVHCPTANTFLNSGIMDRRTLRHVNVPLGIGSDIGAGYERSMIRVARQMILSATELGESFPTADEAWYAITAGNADALGWKDAGRLRVGAAADLLVIRPSIDWLSRQADALAALMFGWDDRWLDTVLLRGRCVVRGGTLTDH